MNGRGGNGLDRTETVTGLNKTVESRLWAGAKAIYWIITVLLALGMAGIGAATSYWRNDSAISSRLATIETRQSAHDIALKEKQSKEAADAQSQIILNRLNEMEKRWDTHWQTVQDEMEMMRAESERGRRP